MRCETAQVEVSAHLDGARLDEAASEHVRGCDVCRAFESSALRLRQAVRLQPAAPVPNLVPRIMEAIEPGPPARHRDWRRPAVAFAAGVVAAVLVVGGIAALRREPAPALAGEIPRRVAEASVTVSAFRATYEIAERGFHPQVPRRTFRATVTFREPERLRVEVRDLSAYPSAEWPRDDLTLASDGMRWLLRTTPTCPREALPACPSAGTRVEAVRGREPFDGDTPLPTDVILPIRTLSGTDRVRVLGETHVDGRRAVVVRLLYRDAVPLVSSIQGGGGWRPFFPDDRVRIALDAESWFPLSYEVTPSPAPERDLWALRHSLPVEEPGRWVLRAELRSFTTTPRVTPGPPSLPPNARDEGFRDRPPAALAETGPAPLVPSDLRGLRLTRSGVFDSPGRPGDEVLLAYSRGLSWLKVRQTRSWAEPGLFGDVGDLAMAVDLPGGGVGYYEPATAELGRRLSISAPEVDLYLETNLPRRELMAIAASMPVSGVELGSELDRRRLPGGAVQIQVSEERARRLVPGMLLPSELPAGYRTWATVLLRAGGRLEVTSHYLKPGAELDGMGIRLHQAPGLDLPPATDPAAQAVRVRGLVGRYSPSRGELEWVEHGIYRSVEGGALDLAGLLGVAESLEPAG